MITQPREKLLSGSITNLSLTDIVALLLGSGVAGKPVARLSAEVATLLLAGERNPTAFTAISGLGPAKASVLVAALELSQRLSQQTSNSPLTSPAAIYALCADLVHAEQEWFAVFSLDPRNQLIKREVITVGTADQTLVHARDVFRSAIRANACAIAVAHNHPSGILQPSTADKTTTKRLAEAGKLLGITVVDHIICGATGFVSLRLVDAACFCNTHL